MAEALLWAGLALLCFRALSFPAYSQDTWFYLKSGEVIAAQRGFPAQDPFAQAEHPAPFPRSAWLFSLGSYAAASLAGLDGLVALRVLLSALSLLALAWFLRRRGAAPGLSVLLTLWVLWGTRLLWTERPHAATFPLFVAGLACLDAQGARRRWGLFAVCLLWSNLHDSSVLFGVLLGAWLLLEALTVRRGPGRALLDAAAAAAGLLLNPGGTGPWLRVWRWYTRPGVFRATIPEWAPPTLDTHLPYFILLGVFLALALMLAAQRRLRLEPALLWAAVLAVLAMGSQRYVPYAMLSMAVVLAGQAGRPVPEIRTALAALAAAALLAGGLWSAREPDLGRLEPLWEKFPVGAAEFLAQDPPAGRLANSRWDGDYLLWRLGPGQKVFIDSRLDLVYPFARLAHEESMFGGSQTWRESLNGYHISAVLVPRLPREAPLAALLRADPAWRVVYRDETSLLFARGDERGRHGTWPVSGLP